MDGNFPKSFGSPNVISEKKGVSGSGYTFLIGKSQTQTSVVYHALDDHIPICGHVRLTRVGVCKLNQA